MIDTKVVEGLHAGDVIEAGTLFGALTSEPICWEVVKKVTPTRLHLSASWEGVFMGMYDMHLEGGKEETLILRRL
ncbi:MAG: hypothetical protein GQ570_03805 [Helicobacteraceae bacterium]|nr:hypothetical protein [Helicobacteraceae bacterium]